MLHAFVAAIPHGVDEALALAFSLFNVFARTHRGFQNFDCGHTAGTIFSGNQALRNDQAKSLGDTIPYGLLIGERKHADDALDGF